MTKKMSRALFAVLLLLSVPVLTLTAQNDDDETTEEAQQRVVELYSSPNTALRFNVPIPDTAGWVNRSTDELAHFQNTALGADIYVTALDGTDLSASIVAVLNDLLDEPTLEIVTESEVNLGGTRWLQQLYTLPDGRDITAFGGLRDTDDIYVLTYVNSVPDVDYSMLVVQQDDANIEAGISIVLTQLDINAEAVPDREDMITLSNGDWLQQVYEREDVRLLAQQRPGNATYVVVERNGDGTLLEGVNKQFFTVFLGFFVTPNNDQYLWLGISVSALLVLGLIATFVTRRRNLKKDIALIQQLREE